MPTVTTIEDRTGLHAIAATLPDTPETVIALHTLRRGLCRAYIVGTIEHHSALVIDSSEVIGEPSCYGDDANAFWSILRELPGWFAANMRESVANAFGALVERDLGEPVHCLGDPHFVLQRPVPPLSDPAVRLLTPDDLQLLDAAPDEVCGAGFGSTRALLEDGIVSAAVVNDAVVSITHTSAITDRHADIGVSTLADWRGRGYATVAASLVAHSIQTTGRTPVWSCGETNQPSLRIATKLGFEPVLRRVYVIVEARRPQPDGQD